MAGRLTIAALAFGCLLAAPSTVGARATRPADSELSSRLAELAKPAVRSAPRAKQAAILDVAPSGPGSLLRDGNRVLVDVRFGSGASAGVDDLRAAGGEIVHVSRRYQTVTVAVPPVALHDVADVARVEGVTENLAPLVFGADDPGPVASAVTPCFGAATSEGDLQLNAMKARDGFNVDGSGITVGILSDSFNKDSSAPTNAAQDVASGDLPGPDNPCGHSTPVNVLDDFTPSLPGDPPPGDEGRAMAQIVHDLAPGAAVAFATAFDGEMEFADNIRALGAAGAKVIVDDVSYFDEPFFQDGPVAVAVNDVTADGAAYFSSAGNNNLIDGSGRNIASWEAPQFRDSDSCPIGAPGYAAHCMDFNPGGGVDTTFGITVSADSTLLVDLQWAQPWDGVTTDLDAYLLDFSSNLIAGSEEFNVTTTKKPFEFLVWTNTAGSPQTVRLAINRCDVICGGLNGGDTNSPLFKFILAQNGSGVTATEYPESSDGDVVGPTIFGHNGAANALSTGAIRYNATPPGSSETWAPEKFSSRGPVNHYFGPVMGTTPAAPISKQTISKPDVVATDGGANTFFGSCVSNVWRFFGTSASAPHAAAVAALEFDALLPSDPTPDPAVIKAAQIDTAQPVGLFTADEVGAGMIDAFRAVESLASPSSGSQFAQSTSPNCGLPGPPPPTPVAPDTITPNTSPPPPSSTGDVVAPQTFFAAQPAKLVRAFFRWAWVQFLFRASEDDVSFLCKVDSGRFHPCPALFSRWFGAGRHVVRAKARDAAGNVDPTPAVYRFRIERGHR